MARRRLLTREALARQLDPPADEREIARHFTLTREDLDWVSIRRGPASQLGYAMMLLYMRWPGRILGVDETPPAAVLSFVARQLDVPEAAWHNYGRREPTRRAHLADLARRMGYRAFGRTDFHALATFGMPVAQTIIQPLQLAEIVIDEMRRRRLLLPPVTVIEAIVRRARRQADELVHDVLTQGLGDGGRTRLNALLARRGDQGATWLSWLRNPPLSPAPRNVMRLLERLDHVRAIGLAPARAATIPAAAFDRISDEAVRITSQHLAELPDRRRHAVLAAAALRLRESLADAVLTMMTRRADNVALKKAKERLGKRGEIPRTVEAAKNAGEAYARQKAVLAPWEKGAILKQRDIKAAYEAVAVKLATSSVSDDRTLARQVAAFVASMPGPLSHRLAHAQAFMTQRDRSDVERKSKEPETGLPPRPHGATKTRSERKSDRTR